MLALRPAALATRTARAARAFRATGRAVARPALAHARARPAGSPDRRAGVRCRATAAGPRVDNDVVVPGADHASLPKNFEHGDTEERLYQWWEEHGCFQPDPNASGEPFCIAMPPPNVTGALHMGHAMFVTLQDIMARVARMRGRPTLWLPGSDHAGIATQLVVERSLEAEGLTREGIGREAFEERTWAWKEEYGGRIAGQIRRLGASCDWTRERFTLDDGLSEAVLECFMKLHDDGLIYKGTYMVNWAPKLQTAVSDLEVEYADEPWHIILLQVPGGAD
jgi:valyl-tRNA synthetase